MTAAELRALMARNQTHDTETGSLSTHGAAHARKGYHVVPGIPEQKRPSIRTGKDHCDAATCDEAKIQSWARQFPDADALIVTKASGITVFDGDTKAGFDADRWVAEHPEYVHVRTGVAPEPSEKYPNSLGGMRGVQTYFRDDEGTFSGDIAEMPGAEFRSHGSLVVAPGGRHKSGVRYE